MARVFISYARKDGSEAAEWLYNRLRSEGIDAFRDIHNLDKYREFDEELKREIDGCSHMVVIGTEDLRREDSFCHREIERAQEKGKRISVLNLGYVPKSVDKLTWIEFRDRTNHWQAGYDELVKRFRDAELADMTVYLKKYIDDPDFADWAHVYFQPKDTTSAFVKSPAATRRLAKQKRTIHKSIQHETESTPEDLIVIETFNELYGHIRGDYRRVAFIGEPGAGKTTTLQRLTYEFATKAAGFWQGKVPDHTLQATNPIPLYVELGGFESGTFEDYLSEAFNRLPDDWQINNSFTSLQIDHYLPNRIVFLLDGLNEITKERAELVQAWVNSHNQSSIIISCRKLNYDNLQLHLHRIDVRPLDVSQIQPFIEQWEFDKQDAEAIFWGLAGEEATRVWNWYKKSKPNGSFEDFWFGEGKVSNSADPAQKYLDNMRLRLRNEEHLPGMLGVVTNPYLLTLVIGIYDETHHLPRNRHAIFDDFVTGLMEDRGKLAQKMGVKWIDKSFQLKALSRLAYQMQVDKKARVADKAYAKKYIQEACPTENPDDLLMLAASANLIEINGDDVQFTHQLLQEYFAANEMYEDMKRGVSASKYFPGDAWWEITGWEETAVLLAGMTQNAAGKPDPTPVVEWLTPVHPSLAYRCATESGAACSEEALQALYEPSAGARRSPMARAAWGRKIAEEQKDKRPGISLRNGIPDIAWCEVLVGPFLMGGDRGVARTYWQGETFDIDYVYYISKYPVTYAQYEPFVQEGGYSERSYWTEAGWAWRNNDGNPILSPSYWDDNLFHISNHPVVGLSWYECYAYSRWLSKKFGYLVRMPTEAEWEKAARYPDGRFLPWGNDYLVGAANVDETNKKAAVGPHQVNRPTAVGMYEHAENPLGISDMSGNVWEWQLSPIQLDFTHHLPEEVDAEGDTRRETRGGSWKNDMARSRLAYRGSNPPESQDPTDGFRLVCTSYDLTLEEWDKRVEQALIRKANTPKPVEIPRLRGRVAMLNASGGTILQSDGITIVFDIAEVKIPADYPDQYQMLPQSFVEYGVEGESDDARATKISHILHGIVDDWDPERAYGEIIAPDGQRIYMHQSVIATIDDWRVMKDGDRVEFELFRGYLYGIPSWEARNVRIVKNR